MVKSPVAADTPMISCIIKCQKYEPARGEATEWRLSLVGGVILDLCGLPEETAQEDLI